MRITVDREACTGHGRCYAVAPGIFEPDDDGYCLIPVATVAEAEEALARRGAANCPEDAITVHDE